MYKQKINKKTVIYLSFYAALVLELILILPLQVILFSGSRSKVKDIGGKVKHYKQALREKDSIVEKIEKSKNKIKNLKTKIISSQDIFVISSYISSTAGNNKVEVLKVFPKTSQELTAGSFLLLPIEVTAQARFHDIGRVVNAIEHGKYFLSVDKISIVSGSPYHNVTFIFKVLVNKGDK